MLLSLKRIFTRVADRHDNWGIVGGDRLSVSGYLLQKWAKWVDCGVWGGGNHRVEIPLGTRPPAW